MIIIMEQTIPLMCKTQEEIDKLLKEYKVVQKDTITYLKKE